MFAPVENAVAALLVDAGVDASIAGRLSAFAALVLDENERVNVTGAHDPGAIVPHLLDALTLLPLLGPQQRLVDVGSGGGFPALPLAVAGDIDVTLIEPVGKKAAFLRRAAATLGIRGQIVAERAEVAGRDPAFRERFDVATARAVGRAPTVAELTLPLVRVGGRALLQRGTFEARERAALDDAALILSATVSEELPLADNRRIVVLEKRSPIGQRFPRRNGVPEKRPLCL